jgi:Effector Associated Constant Component 1
MVSTTLSLTSNRGDAAIVNMTRDLQRDLAKADIPVKVVEAPSKPEEKGDAFSLGQLAIDLVTSGAITALVECLKAYLQRDETLSFKIKRPDGSDIEVKSHNIDSAALRDNLELLIPKK